MAVDFDKKDLAKYPFLKESQQLVSSRAYSIDALLSGSTGELILKKSSKRVLDAISAKKTPPLEDLEFPEGEILSYVLARIVVSCMGDRAVMDRLARYESLRVYSFLQNEDPEKKRYIATHLGIDLNSETLPMKTYVELTTVLRDPEWRLVNRQVSGGQVRVEKDELEELLRERIRIILLNQLPLRIPETICDRLKAAVDSISAAYQEKMLEEFGEIEEECFPPCMNALIDAITKGTNIPHTGRFALTAFLHMIGMNPVQIVEIFTRAPDFDVSKTTYQVEHISGRGGTEYTPPACATMRTFGLCAKKDTLCDHVNHPLSYYKAKKKGKKSQD